MSIKKNNKQRRPAHLMLCLTSLLLCAYTSNANATIDNDADIVTVRQDCGTTDNCFTDLTLMADWVHNTRIPDATNPLLVSISTGNFYGFYCSGQDHITIRGSGRDNTVLLGKKGGPGGNRINTTAIAIDSCTNLTFENLSIRGKNVGILWTGSGNSIYNNIELSVKGGNTTFAWYDSCEVGTEKSVHNFFGSSIIAEGTFYNFGYYTDCAETWLYGSDVLARGMTSNNLLANKAFRIIGDNAVVQVFGSAVRSLAGEAQNISATINSAQGLTAVSLQDGGTFHMHGGILTAKATGALGNVDVASIQADGTDNTIHVIGTAFNPIAAGSGTAHRIKTDGNTTVNSPQLWTAGTTPPKGNPNGDSIQSINGADMYVETDCDSSGDCNAAGTETHVMVYNTNCTTDGTWFNSTTGRCRGVTEP